jgi:hypothetical protein
MAEKAAMGHVLSLVMLRNQPTPQRAKHTNRAA